MDQLILPSVLFCKQSDGYLCEIGCFSVGNIHGESLVDL